jgi:hypothetical protein
VLNTLRTRYLDKDVYTYCGIVLVAINPFEDLPIYTERVMREYHGKQMGELEPHLYALAEAVRDDIAIWDHADDSCARGLRTCRLPVRLLKVFRIFFCGE